MKKLLSLILFFNLLLFTVSCTKNDIPENDPKQLYSKEDIFTEPQNYISEKTSEKDVGGGDLSLTKYRSIYCSIPRPFANLVDLYEFEEWYDVVIENDPNKTEIMPMKLFVQEFNISREEFDKANLEWTKIIINGFHGTPMMNPQDFANQETDEVYNADIIYTFDDEVINNYYLSHEYPFVYISDYENAVADGTYQTRTTDWVDIAQMEAEIIAKYGEAEIVTETETTAEAETENADAPEEAVPTDSVQIETNE